MNKQVVGYVLAYEAARPPVYPAGRYGFISDLFVLEPYRGQGIGRALVRRALLWLRTIGVTSVELLASEHNEHAQRFWEAVGFRRFLRMYRLDMLP